MVTLSQPRACARRTAAPRMSALVWRRRRSRRPNWFAISFNTCTECTLCTHFVHMQAIQARKSALAPVPRRRRQQALAGEPGFAEILIQLDLYRAVGPTVEELE